ncbi:biopolymer transporter ExbD [Saprospiraceae bacterium]|jgi:biopolymer transport protein ExbD|nr:biopolymer transporter ExbD [Saprospiraceae bacterium]MDF1866863.1 biopolymer transporter ExbD [Saprospiraceae bacterium]
MGIKKRNKVSAEFSMSSLTDIIFLLLIFFMLTSSLVAPNSLFLKMPGTSTSKLPPSSKKIDDVAISSSGKYRLNGKTYSLSNLEKELGRRQRAKKEKYTVAISPNTKAPIDNVVYVMDIMKRYKIDGILAAEPD